jgi:hypothetical protein
MLQLLQQEGLVCTEGTAVQAVMSGRLHVLQFLHAEGCPLDSIDVWGLAAELGEAAMFKWLHSVGVIQVVTNMTAFVAVSGSIELMQYLQQHGITPDHKAMKAAVRCGDLGIYHQCTRSMTALSDELYYHYCYQGTTCGKFFFQAVAHTLAHYSMQAWYTAYTLFGCCLRCSSL